MSYEIMDIKGDVLTLDPKSKLIITGLMILGVAVSIDIFQVLVFSVFTIPISIIYKPTKKVFKKFLLSTPFIIIVVIVLSLSLKEDITINLFHYHRPYSPAQFTRLIAFRFAVSSLHSVILLDSEPNTTSIIEGINAFKINQNLSSILLLINRIAGNVKQKYDRMVLAAKTRGALQMNTLQNTFFKLQLLGRILAETISQSDHIADTLTARGFDGEFTVTIRDWTSDGLTMVGIASVFWIIVLVTPLLRP
ncbi:MAG: hypothetical protein GPJ54_06605 [Candidatus Heimdallarchaeota archaeon]|nr:hypothetical protein [Candidatus Heimdallarchaeota archaeon]